MLCWLHLFTWELADVVGPAIFHTIPRPFHSRPFQTIPGQITKVRVTLDTTLFRISLLIDLWGYPWRLFRIWNSHSSHFTRSPDIGSRKLSSGSFLSSKSRRHKLKLIICLLFFAQGRKIITANQHVVRKKRD